MDVIAAVFADFEQAFPGGRSRLLADLGGRPVLVRTLERLCRIEGLARRCLVVRPRDEAAARAALSAAGLAERVEVLPIDDGARPRRELYQAARRWNLDGWRGGPLGATWFDEYIEPAAVARVMNETGCENVLCLDGHQAAVDWRILAAMLAHLREHDAEARFVFTQAPPGLAGVVLRREVVQELVQNRWPLGILLSYRPEMPFADPITRPVCCQIDGAVAQTGGRWLADTRRGMELLEEAFAALGEDCSGGELCAWLLAHPTGRAGALPVEVELELTTEDRLAGTALRPRVGSGVKRDDHRSDRSLTVAARLDDVCADWGRTLDDLAAVDRLAGELGAYDDRLVCLGGHGDPLLHPDFAEVCRRLRAGGVAGVSVVTPLVELPEAVLEALFEHRVDVVEVQLDADSPETYERVHGVAAFSAVAQNLERLLKTREARQRPRPIVVCSLTRCVATAGEVETFFDRWIQRAQGAVIHGYNDYCGALPADGLLSMTPPVREPCRRLGSRLMLLADGCVPDCGQDFAGATRLGDWRQEPLREIWGGSARRALMEDHSRLDFSSRPACGRCGEWFRP